MDESDNMPKDLRTRGRPFQQGNPGRARGSKNRATIFAAALLEGEAEGLFRTCVEAAHAGNIKALLFLLGRMLPRDRLIKLDLPPMNFADDAVEAFGRVMRAVAEGRISPSEGAQMATLIDSFAKAIDIADVVKRLDALEAKVKGDA
jgi:hypothetical protein